MILARRSMNAPNSKLLGSNFVPRDLDCRRHLSILKYPPKDLDLEAFSATTKRVKVQGLKARKKMQNENHENDSLSSNELGVKD